jgi:hypothetical protein
MFIAVVAFFQLFAASVLAWVLNPGTILAALAIGAVLLWARRPLRGTTLMAPWYWAAVSLVLLAGVELLLACEPRASQTAWLPALRYLSAIGTFGPIMATLGAKRPQDGPWQFIVLSLLVVLAMPSAQAILSRAGGRIELHGAWSGFVCVLVGVGLCNYLPTRFSVASILFALAQVCLLAPFIPWLRTPSVEFQPLLGTALFAVAAIAALLAPRRYPAGAKPIERLWIDFRNAFGSVWGLRVAERINASSKMYGWNLHLSWSGFITTAEPATGASPETDAAVVAALKTLLRRFVSPEWIDQRLS